MCVCLLALTNSLAHTAPSFRMKRPNGQSIEEENIKEKWKKRSPEELSKLMLLIGKYVPQPKPKPWLAIYNMFVFVEWEAGGNKYIINVILFV